MKKEYPLRPPLELIPDCICGHAHYRHSIITDICYVCMCPKYEEDEQ